MSTKKISILCGVRGTGPWASSSCPCGRRARTCRARGECLYCAVESAALAGCPEVIACGGGRVSAEALEAHKRDVEVEKLHVRTTVTIPEPLAKVAVPLISSPLSPPMSPPPPYGSPSPPDMFEYFAESDATSDKDCARDLKQTSAHIKWSR